MENLRRVFAISSVIFLIVLALSPLKDYFREWKSYQIQYNTLIKDLPKRVPPTPIGIKQMWIQKFDRVDRCVTCHLGIKDDALISAHQPYTTHPHIFHDVEDFGCTICHEGQGAATEFKESIGRVKFWDKPIFPREFMEASCAKCHKERTVPHAPILTSGRAIIEESNCVGCHKIEGYEKQWVPPLDGIGTKVNRAWLVNWLKNPKAYSPKTRMPNFELPMDEVNILADFLMSFKDLPNGATLQPVPPQLADANAAAKTKLVELGTTRFSEARCISCHSVNGKGGYVANELGKIASKDSKEWLYNYIRDPKHLFPGVEMSRFRLKEDELEGMVAYIENEFVDYDMEQPPERTPDPAFYEKGLALFKKYNCNGCHQLSAAPKPEETGPDLTLIGSKKIYEIDFGKTTIEQTLPSYIHTKLATPRVFSAVMKMPNFQFSKDELQAVTVALLGNTNDKIPPDFIVHPKPKSTFVPQGEFGKLVKDFACMSCHVMNGNGRLVATDLSMEASQAHQGWIEGYFKVPYSLRPILTERMPNFFMSETEIKTIADYMEKAFVVDSLDRDIPSDVVTVSKGRALYFDKYGCQSCHQIASKGGYVGPPLDKIGTRLKGGWIFHWLKDPEAYRPGSIEPDNKLTDDEADALAAFLLSLK
jgi:mono/diheme cytochrome c family protein